MTCPNCNREIPDGSNICGYCSADLRSGAAGGYQYKPQRQQSHFGMTGGATKITPRGLMVIGAGLVVVILLIWLLISLFSGGEDPGGTNAAPPAEYTPQVFRPINETPVPEGYTEPEETVDPFLTAPLAVEPTATPEPTPMPEFEKLAKGAKGDAVTMLQTRLKYNGFLTGDVDGQYGPATYEAVKLFQESANLVVDGIAGPETLRTLYSLPYDESLAANSLDSAPGAVTQQLDTAPDSPG